MKLRLFDGRAASDQEVRAWVVSETEEEGIELLRAEHPSATWDLIFSDNASTAIELPPTAKKRVVYLMGVDTKSGQITIDLTRLFP